MIINLKSHICNALPLAGHIFEKKFANHKIPLYL